MTTQRLLDELNNPHRPLPDIIYGTVPGPSPPLPRPAFPPNDGNGSRTSSPTRSGE